VLERLAHRLDVEDEVAAFGITPARYREQEATE
jgi:hypothetical protein